MLERCNITSQQRIFAVLQERKLNLLPSKNLMGIDNHCLASSPPPILVWLLEVVDVSV